MKIILLILCCKFILSAAEMVLPEGTAAVVNGVAIMEDELDREVGKQFPSTYFHTTLNDEKLKKLKEKSLTSLIEKTLLYTYAKSKKITVRDNEVEEIIEKLHEVYGSKEVLKDALKKLGFTEMTFFETVRKDEILKKLYKSEIETIITKDELKNYYDENSYKFTEPEKIKVSLIQVKNDPLDPEGNIKAKKRIEEAYEKIKSGEPFSEVARKYSMAMSRINGGDMGYLHRGRLDISVEEKAFSMDVNTTSKIIKKDIGFFYS